MSYEVEHDVHINKTLCDVSPGAGVARCLDLYYK